MEELKSVTIEIPKGLAQEIESFSQKNSIDQQKIFKDALNLYLDYQELQESQANSLTADPNNKPLSHDEFFDGLDF